MFHRNRAIQVRRGTNLDRLFHVITACNPSDLGTRPEKVLDSDIGPKSKWENGLSWITEDEKTAVDKGILTPSSDMRLTEEDSEEYEQGMVFEKTSEILVRGHVSTNGRKDKLLSQLQFSNYLVSPLKFCFKKILT